MSSNTNELYKLWRSKKFQILMDVCRLLLVVGIGVIIYLLVSEFEAVKLLAYDPCAICMDKTGATCWFNPIG